MKFLIGAAAATLLMASPALAQTPATAPDVCVGFAAAPSVPDGATATPEAMATMDTEFRAWHGTGSAKLQQCRAEVEAMRARLAATETAYNAGVALLNGTRDAWQVEVDEYNARAPARNRRN
ncbi:MAG: hypothetical protein M0D54_14435 [Hyphomonadaceae bacterium JAD_PAG50586_4]|nr:MAG: hypothetical protein M0D54_14435 [Hyphomonadaceae bacterium JAD_PAG50586_4]